MTQFLEGRLKLKVNVTKSAVDCPWNRTFLGYSMTWHKNPRIKIAASSVERLKAGLRQIFRRGRGRTLGQVIEESKPKLRGWIAYFRLAEARGIFEDLDGWVRRKLRCILWRQWKCPYTRARKLMQRGVTGTDGLEIGHKRARPLVELRRLAHEQCIPEILLRQSGVDFVK